MNDITIFTYGGDLYHEKWTYADRNQVLDPIYVVTLARYKGM